MTRREVLAAAVAPAVLRAAQPGASTIAVECYIFQQYAQSSKQALGSVFDQVLPMARDAGFKNVELTSAFLARDMRERVVSRIESLGLRVPSVYVGGPMHEKEGAERTISSALEIAEVCRSFGCKGIVNNPDPKPGGQRKTDAELQVEADSLNRMGRSLAGVGYELRVHHHTPQLVENAREWRFLLQHTDAEYVQICVDVDWAYEAGFAAIPFLEQVGGRLRELHVRSARNKVWLEDLEDSDIDYRQVARYLREQKLTPLIVVELAYMPSTVVTRSLLQDLQVSRVYAEQVFGVGS